MRVVRSDTSDARRSHTPAVAAWRKTVRITTPTSIPATTDRPMASTGVRRTGVVAGGVVVSEGGANSVTVHLPGKFVARRTWCLDAGSKQSVRIYRRTAVTAPHTWPSQKEAGSAMFV